MRHLKPSPTLKPSFTVFAPPALGDVVSSEILARELQALLVHQNKFVDMVNRRVAPARFKPGNSPT
jgi:hypothetical protein